MDRDDTLIFVVGIMAIAIMLAILTLDPDLLAQSSVAIDSNHWHFFSHICLFIVILLWLSLKLFKFNYQTAKQSDEKQKIVLTRSLRQYLTPVTVIIREGIWPSVIKLFSILLFLLAVVFNSLAQRMHAIEFSPTKIEYIEAIAIPVGLSDKRLEFESGFNLESGSEVHQTQRVDQGYRQLMLLTHIQPTVNHRYIPKTNTATFKDNNKSSNTQINASDDITSNPFLTQPSSVLANTDSILIEPNTATIKFNNSETLPKTMRVMLNSYNKNYKWLNQLAPDNQIKVRLKIQPLTNNTNPNEFNEYRWLSTRHAVATAQIVEASASQVHAINSPNLWQKIDLYRYGLREHFLSLMDSQQYATATDNTQNASDSSSVSESDLNPDAIAVTLSLLTGDRSLISQDMTGLYRFAGISHLLAISGAHVLFLAILMANLAAMIVNRLCPSLYRIMPRWQLKFMVAVGVAFAYAMFAGFDVPAVRTAWMLIIVGIVRYLLATPSVYKVLLVLAVAMAWHDVFVLWQAGFWLSFVAVAMLVIYSQRWEVSHKDKQMTEALLSTKNKVQTQPTRLSKLKQLLFSFLKLQLWMSAALLPVSLWLFGKVSLWGFLVNLFALGLFGWVIVPLNLLAGILYTVTPQLADLIWQLLFRILTYFHRLLMLIQSNAQQLGWLHNDMSLAVLLLLLILALPWMLPKGLINRYLSLPALSIICLLPFLTAMQSQNTMNVTVLNTGNSKVSATLISQEDQHWLLISAYPNVYLKSSQNSNHEWMGQAQTKKLIQTLYDTLRSKQIDTLTGVIVQTATPGMAKIVAGLRKNFPISYYWQAGLNQYSDQVVTDMQSTGLSAQSCEVGKTWQQSLRSSNGSKTEQEATLLTISAVTGWPSIEDNTVWDCTLLLKSPYATKIIQNQDSTSSEVAVISNINQELIIYTSEQPKLAKLWQLMCVEEKNNSSQQDTKFYTAQPYFKKDWLFESHSKVGHALIDMMQPISWHVLKRTESTTSDSESLKEAQLYWQQRYAANIF